MASLFEYYNMEFSHLLSIDSHIYIDEADGNTGEIVNNMTVKTKCLDDHISCSKTFTYYLNQQSQIGATILALMERYNEEIKSANNLHTIPSFRGQIDLGSYNPTYSKNLYFYTEFPVSAKELLSINLLAKSKGFMVIIRGENYMNSKNNLQRPQAFISHDSNDKDEIARVIAQKLSSRLCPVWYDEYSLKVGDSLRESIESGIKEAHKCILLLTPNFIKNNGWGKKEFNSIFTRELIFEEKIVLPIWYKVSKKDIYEYSPSLADTFALNWPEREKYTDEEEYNRAVEICISKVHTAITTEC